MLARSLASGILTILSPGQAWQQLISILCTTCGRLKANPVGYDSYRAQSNSTICGRSLAHPNTPRARCRSLYFYSTAFLERFPKYVSSIPNNRCQSWKLKLDLLSASTQNTHAVDSWRYISSYIKCNRYPCCETACPKCRVWMHDIQWKFSSWVSYDEYWFPKCRWLK